MNEVGNDNPNHRETSPQTQSMDMRKEQWQAVVRHTCHPNTWEAEKGGSHRE